MKGRRHDFPWELVLLGLVLVAPIGLLVWAIWLSSTQVYDEPTSRCIDVKYRIFERGGEEGFSVVEDLTCANDGVK